MVLTGSTGEKMGFQGPCTAGSRRFHRVNESRRAFSFVAQPEAGAREAVAKRRKVGYESDDDDGEDEDGASWFSRAKARHV